MDEIQILNSNFYLLYGQLYSNKKFLTKKQYDFMTDKLFEQYKSEYVKLAIEKETEDNKQLFILKFRNSGYVPRKFLWFKNSAYKLMKAQMIKELDNYFDNKFEELANLSNTLQE